MGTNRNIKSARPLQHFYTRTTCKEQIIDLRLTLCHMGAPIKWKESFRWQWIRCKLCCYSSLIQKCTTIGSHYYPIIEWDGQSQLASSIFTMSLVRRTQRTCWANIGIFPLFGKWWSRFCFGMRRTTWSLRRNQRKTRRRQAMAPIMMW